MFINSINRQDKNGEYPLLIINRLGGSNLLKHLIAIDSIDPNLADNEGNTSLIHAAQVFRMLLN